MLGICLLYLIKTRFVTFCFAKIEAGSLSFDNLVFQILSPPTVLGGLLSHSSHVKCDVGHMACSKDRINFEFLANFSTL